MTAAASPPRRGRRWLRVIGGGGGWTASRMIAAAVVVIVSNVVLPTSTIATMIPRMRLRGKMSSSSNRRTMIVVGGGTFSSSSSSYRLRPPPASMSSMTNAMSTSTAFFPSASYPSHPSRATSSLLHPSSSSSFVVAGVNAMTNIMGESLSALTATIAGGIFAGSLHAISGPDHLAAIIPRCCGLPWHRALRVGIVWGLGHGLSATLLGLVGYAFKAGILGSHVLDRLGRWGGWGGGGGGKTFFGIVMGGREFDLLHHAGSLMELAIGISLIVIGLLGIKEAREWHDVVPVAETAADDFDDIADDGEVKRTRTPKRAVLLNGLLHGFSWDGAPSLAPAVAISTFRGSLAFLLSYALGTMGAMALATTIIGEGTRRAAGRLDRPNLPRDLSLVSSVLAIVVGVVWGRHEDGARGGDWGGAWYDRAVSGIIVGSIDMRSLFENDIQANGGGNASGRGRGRFR
ncbi:hypothetical protein ACHAXA_002997 [Cyclostephanos tholiformis]|uniref:Uncharacterized protein n=1 Tax=Cyclostephanos tholiformis TaxID=382380 RepID=A0ABD3SC82_9STRA